jgi:hypothetical protein
MRFLVVLSFRDFVLKFFAILYKARIGLFAGLEDSF